MTVERKTNLLVLWCVAVSCLAFWGFTDTLRTDTPQSSDSPAEADDRMREIKGAFVERLDIDHYFTASAANTYDAADTGKHRFLTFAEPNSISSVDADEGILFTSDVGGISELMWRDESENEIQLTTAGKFNLSGSTVPDDTIDDGMIELANNAYLVGSNAAGNGDVSLIKANASDKAQLSDGAVMATSAAPTVDAGIANKKYVDDQVAATVQTSGVTVFNGTVSGASTWQDLDLSAQVGAGVAWVYLEVTASGGNYVAAKPKGYGSATFADHYSSGPLGASMTQAGSGKYSYLVCMTDSSGVIQIGSQYATAFTMKLIGFVK